MVIFYSYVSLPEGTSNMVLWMDGFSWVTNFRHLNFFRYHPRLVYSVYWMGLYDKENNRKKTKSRGFIRISSLFLSNIEMAMNWWYTKFSDPPISPWFCRPEALREFRSFQKTCAGAKGKPQRLGGAHPPKGTVKLSPIPPSRRCNDLGFCHWPLFSELSVKMEQPEILPTSEQIASQHIRVQGSVCEHHGCWTVFGCFCQLL